MKKNFSALGKTAAWLLFWSLLLAIGYGVQPLYSGNQNHKFIHGLAQAGYGLLDRDWMASTTDPTPVFTVLVRVTYSWLGPSFFYVEQGLLFVVYFAAMARLFIALGESRPGPPLLSLFAATTVFLHSYLLSDLSKSYLGVDLRMFLQDGLAAQYLLGDYLQPSVFGVFLVLSIAAFVEDKPLQATVFAAVAAVMHFTYLISALILVATYALLLFRRSPKTASLLVLTFSLLNLPTIVYTMTHFGPSSSETFRFAQDLMANRRFPHHCVLAKWFDLGSLLQVNWVVLAIYLTRRTRLAAILFVSLLVSMAFTAIQVASGSDSLALLFPWRPSVYLVPIATTIIFGKLLYVLWRQVGSTIDRLFSSGHIGWIAVGFPMFIAIQIALPGALATRDEWERRNTSDLAEMMTYVREHRSEGQLYMIPIVALSDELQYFRLGTGMPIYVDYKCHPYKDVEVVEWWHRVETCKKLYRSLDQGTPLSREDRDTLKKAGISHIVLSASPGSSFEPDRLVFANTRYTVLRLAGSPPR